MTSRSPLAPPLPSVIIGVGVGVITQDRQLVIVLLVALVVHQGLEGLSLGTVLALANFTRAKKARCRCTASPLYRLPPAVLPASLPYPCPAPARRPHRAHRQAQP